MTPRPRGVKLGRPTALTPHNGGKPCRGLLMAKRKQTWLGASRSQPTISRLTAPIPLRSVVAA